MFAASYFPKSYFTGAYWPPRDGGPRRIGVTLRETRAFVATASDDASHDATGDERTAFGCSATHRSRYAMTIREYRKRRAD